MRAAVRQLAVGPTGRSLNPWRGLLCRGRVAAGLILIAGLLMLSGCTKPPRPEETKPLVAMVPVDGTQLAGFEDDLAYIGLSDAIDQSLDYLRSRPADRQLSFGADAYPVHLVVETLEHLKALAVRQPGGRQFTDNLAATCRIYRAAGRNGQGRVLFTGYYEPFLKGSLIARGAYQYPIYGRPADLVTVNVGRFKTKHAGLELRGRLAGNQLVPYDDRAGIEQWGRSKTMAPVLAWVDDPVGLFFLHIQGSGRVYLDTGGYLNVHYHTTNGHPYRSIGKLLIDRGEISREAMSMQAIRRYLDTHPREVTEILNTNPSYVFFKLEDQGPLGFLNRPLTPGRSLALDRRLFPPGVPVLIRTHKPVIGADGSIVRWQPFWRLVLNQDTGGAIRGAGRADLFWGNGVYAEIAAGHLKHEGEMYFFIRKP